MRRKIRLRKMKYYSIVFSNLCGMCLTALLVSLFSYAGSKTDIPTVIVSILLSLSLSAGGFLSGYLYGHQKRRGGIKGGIICGVILYAIIFVFGIFYLKSIPSLALIKRLILLCVSGAAGGIVGVNSKIKQPPI